MTFIEELDDRIAEATPEERVALVVILCARLGTLGAGMLLALPKHEKKGEPRESHNLSAKEAAKRLGVSRPYLYKHAHELPFARKIGDRVVFDRQGLEEWNAGKRPA